MLELSIENQVKAPFVTQDVELVPQINQKKAGEAYELFWYGY